MPKKANQIIELNPENKSLENSENKTHNPSDKLISPQNQDLLTRIGVYSLNIGSRFLSDAYKAKDSIETIGNFYGALGFATLDVLARKNSKFKRLAKFGGYLFYIGSCGYDLISGLNDFENIWSHFGNFALDVSMASQLGKDMGSLYKNKDNEEDKKLGISDDLESIVSFFTGSDKKENSKSKLKDYLSNFGKGIGLGLGTGYGFGKGAIEKLAETSKRLKENYSVYRTKQKELNELKKIKDEKNKQERAKEKNLSDEEYLKKFQPPESK